MKKLVAIVLVLVIVAFEVSTAYCATCETPAFRKFRRGFCNTLTFYLEIGQQVKREGISCGVCHAATIGVLKGIGMSAARAVTGVYELVTFPVPVPCDYKPIMTDPEFFWTEPFSEKVTK
jgi:putative exosortase-associated protein (TIGR04073 family)